MDIKLKKDEKIKDSVKAGRKRSLQARQRKAKQEPPGKLGPKKTIFVNKYEFWESMKKPKEEIVDRSNEIITEEKFQRHLREASVTSPSNREKKEQEFAKGVF